MLIALFGPPGAGKDTATKRLVEQHGFVRVAFADKVRELAYETLEDSSRVVIDMKGWEVAKRWHREYREILERVGDGARKVFGPDFWIDAIRNQVLDVLRKNGNVVITDLRKENEKRFVNALDLHIFGKSKLWYVTRPGCHKRPFDEWKPEWAAFTIYNNDTIEVLNQRVDEVLELCQ
jgi:hypothetical protein